MEDQAILLADGRTVGFADFGSPPAIIADDLGHFSITTKVVPAISNLLQSQRSSTAGYRRVCGQAGVGYGSVMEPGRLQITFDCLDPARVGTFWAAALAYPAPDVEGWHNFLRSQGRPEEDLNATFAIEDPAGVRPRMFFQRVREPKSVKNRVHLDLAAPAAGSPDRAEQIDAFAERLTALGAQRLRAVKEDGYFVVMADPEGNEFCVD